MFQLQELVIGPLYFAFILYVAYGIRGIAGDATMQRHFLRGLLLKLIGSIFVYIIYFFVYRGGDSYTYYQNSLMLNQAFFYDVPTGLKLYYADPKIYDLDTYLWFRSLNAEDTSTYLLIRISSFFSLFCFKSYLGNAFLLSILSYWGIWRLYVLFTKLFPGHVDSLAIAFLYIPSVFFWGSGLLKDNVTFGFLGFLVSSIYYLILKREKVILNTLIILTSVYIIGVIKGYIVMALIPAIIFWMFMIFRSKIKSRVTKFLITPFLFATIGAVGFFTVTLLGDTFQKFNLDNLESKAKGMQTWHTYVVEVINSGEGSSYSLGEVEFTPIGMIKKIPAAVNVALFRPYLWEIKNALMLLSAAESFVLLIFTISTLYYFVQYYYFGVRILTENPTLIFMLIFSLIFAFSVGFTSYNFGALSRYRIPLLPFYSGAIFIIRNELLHYHKLLRSKKIS